MSGMTNKLDSEMDIDGVLDAMVDGISDKLLEIYPDSESTWF